MWVDALVSRTQSRVNTLPLLVLAPDTQLSAPPLPATSLPSLQPSSAQLRYFAGPGRTQTFRDFGSARSEAINDQAEKRYENRHSQGDQAGLHTGPVSVMDS